MLFGLSMDYQVFLRRPVSSTTRPARRPGRPSPRAWRPARRITTAAALIMTSVFGSFILNGDPTVKQFGVGLAVAVLLAASSWSRWRPRS